MSEEYCKNCKFFEQYQSDERKGACRRYPPQVAFDDYGIITRVAFPELGLHGWCGEWKPRVELPMVEE